MYIITFFKNRDWVPLTVRGKVQKFDTDAEAELFVQEYPRWGSDFGRAIRNGNWQIVPQTTP